MSRIGKLPIQVPSAVKVTVSEAEVSVQGPKGTLTQRYQPEITIRQEGDEFYVDRNNDSKRARAMHGLYRQLLFNMVKGVSDGFKRDLVITGVGYRAEVQGKVLLLNLGYSNPIEYAIPDGIAIACEAPTKVSVSGVDKQQVGQCAAEIRSLRPPEPYKGKGVKYADETVRRKVGKSGVK